MVWGAGMALMLAGCGDAPPARLMLVATPASPAIVPQALGATAQQFLGPGAGGGASGGGAGSGPSQGGSPGSRPLIRPDLLTPGSGTAYRLRQSRARALGLAAERPLRPGLALTGQAMIGAGRLDYRLPQGLGILRDPARITFDTRFAELEAGLAWRRDLTPEAALRLGLAAGLHHSRTRTHVSSALLEIRNKSRQTDPYLALRGDLELRPEVLPGRLHLGGELRLVPGAGVSAGQRLSLEF